MKRWSTRLRRRPERTALAVAFGLLFATGCVTRSTHNQVVGALETEVARLEGRVRDLERSNQALDAERVALVDEMEDLRQEREVLSVDVAKLAKTKELLSEHLRERESQVEELSKLKATYRGLVDDLESEVSAGQIQIEQLREGIRLNLAQDILFRSGSSKLEGTGVAVLRKVANQLRGMTHTVEVQGHTDDVPLSAALAARYGTNWELAAARAASVVRLFEEEKIDPQRLTAVSYGEFAPIASNDTPEGRARNRRIDIRLMPLDAPVPGAPEADSQAPADGVGAGGGSAASP